MNIPITLNGEQTVLDAQPETPLLRVLRQRKLFSVKDGCGKGRCGFCTVLLDGEPVPACLIPAGIARGADVVTLEHFAKSPEYADIADGFAQAGVHPCGYCNAARFFGVHSLLTRVYRPAKDELDALADAQTCPCTDRDSFISGVLYATANRHRREGRKNGL